MQHDLLIDPQDVPHAHSMVLIALRSPERAVAAMTALRSAVQDTAWLDGTESEFLVGTGRDGTWMLAYLPMGAVSDLLLSAEFRGVPLTMEPLDASRSGIERATRRTRRSGRSRVRVRAPQVWAEGFRFEVLDPSAVQVLVADWCQRVVGPMYCIIRQDQWVVSRWPIPFDLTEEWRFISADVDWAADRVGAELVHERAACHV